MPLPEVSKDESRNDFTSRCMGSSEMNSEFPDQSQRFAVCRSIYERKKTSKLSDELDKFVK